MKYIDIQLTDKELWAQFQAKCQAGEYADALALLQTLNQNSGVYVWEKYDAIDGYIVSESPTLSSQISGNALTDKKYKHYTLNSKTGEFTLTEEYSGTMYPYYIATTSKNKIYRAESKNAQNVVLWRAIESALGTIKGSTYYGTVTSEDEAAYPANGEQDGYWYVLVDEPTEGGYKGLIAKALNTLTDYIVRVENLNDSTFKADKPPVQANQPTQNTGQLWFQITN